MPGHGEVDASECKMNSEKAPEKVSDVYIGVFFDGTNNNMVRTAYKEKKNLKKFEKEQNQGLKGFSDNYNLLKKGGIIFPPQNYQIQTYNNYISVVMNI